MARKVFYSWQSDREEKNGRYFLRDALQRVIKELHAEIEFEMAERPELDHDTKGVAGSPGIADVILSKIRESAVFVADVTLIGKADNGKPVINPNVGIELGYALKALGDAGLVMVMNRAHGDRDGLPFDLKHRRGPIYYDLADGADGAVRKAAEDAIIPALKEAIKVRLENLPVPAPAIDRPTLLARAREFHNYRVAELAAGHAPVGVIAGAKLVMHVVPFSAIDEQPALSFNEICDNPNRFPPIGDRFARDWQVDFDGLLTGSNKDGLAKTQRAYVHVSQFGAVEAVVSSITVQGDAIELPNLLAMVSTYAGLYASSLNSFGVKPPMVVLVTLTGVKGMKLLQEFAGRTFREDHGTLGREHHRFNEAIFDTVPQDPAESAKLLRPLLSHLARAAGLQLPPGP